MFDCCYWWIGGQRGDAESEHCLVSEFVNSEVYNEDGEWKCSQIQGTPENNLCRPLPSPLRTTSSNGSPSVEQYGECSSSNHRTAELSSSSGEKNNAVRLETTPPSAKRRKTPAPGATKEAIERLSKLGKAHSYSNAKHGTRKIVTPGATQVAVKKLSGIYDTPSVALNENTQLSKSSSELQESIEPNDKLGWLDGSVVWAKMPSYPWWPAQVQSPGIEQSRLKHASTDTFVVFYGSADYAWLPSSDIKSFKKWDNNYRTFSKVRNKGLQRALDQVWLHLGEDRPDV